jgi:hypothetical protein
MFRSFTIGLVSVLLTVAASVEGKASRENESHPLVQVRIYDYAQVSPETLAEAKRVASSIFRRIGVEISWFDHIPNGNIGKPVEANSNGESGYRKLQLRILNEQMTEKLPVNKTMTGLTFQGTAEQPGEVANIFYHRVEELAKSDMCSKGEILGHAAAHELGHLLLGDLHHSSSGLMKARFGLKDLQRAARGDLLFTEREGTLIRRALVPK